MVKKLGLPATLALGFIALGFVMMGVAWNGAASVDCAECQIPYLLSGGLPGLGLVVLGAGLLLFEAGRRGRARLEQKVDELIGALYATGGSGPPAPEPAVAAANGTVIVGRSSFHRPDCRLVTGKEGLDRASLDEAVARGLNPCRVCDPLTPETTGRRR